MGHAANDVDEQGPLGPFPAPSAADEQGALEPLLASVTCAVRLSGAYRVTGAWHVPTRIKPQYILCIGGAGTADVSVGSEQYTLARDTLVLTPPHVPQSFT